MPPSFWETVRLLLSAAQRRSHGRRTRQQAVLYQRSSKSANLEGFSFFFAILLMIGINIAAAFLIQLVVKESQRSEVEQSGKIVVSDSFFGAIERYEEDPTPAMWEYECPREARSIAEDYGGSRTDVEQRLRVAIEEGGTRDLVAESKVSTGFVGLSLRSRLPGFLGSFVLLLWLSMLVFQGEGLDLDIQRRRHPIWEWLFSHPVRPAAVFLAEMLSPIAANPVYWGAPLCVGFMYGFVYGFPLGVLAAFTVGVPLSIAAACLGKAFEIAVTLRFPLRSRGAVIGLMSWFGYASMMLFFLGLFFIPKLIAATAGLVAPLAKVPWPYLALFLGAQGDGSFSFVSGMLLSLVFAGFITVGSVFFSVWGANQGLVSPTGQTSTVRSESVIGKAKFGKDPLYRKELLWFIRDRSAVIQSILVPLTIAGVQLFNLRGMLEYAQGAWNYLSGAAILFGTYFLWILGPRSLSSEGAALWISMTWPRGMESLLKAKAWLWSLISTGLVGLVLCYAAIRFPSRILQIALVGVGWFFFSRTMAEKTVTLVSVPDASGEKPPVHWGRKWAAQLGMLTFAIGVLTQQWTVAVNGIVYSYLTAAAMWQNFRARLPYLYDPWSEETPRPPTLMHAMIAISILIEGGAVIMSIFIVGGGRESAAIGMAVGYAFSSIAVWIGMSAFLSGREVSARSVWTWNPETSDTAAPQKYMRYARLALPYIYGALGGTALAMFAQGYLAVLRHIPAAEEILRHSQEQMSKIPGLRSSMFVMAVCFAPFAEEYLFRGLLFRALDREWGGWIAVVGSAAFFAIYHQPLSWLPVGLLGVGSALLFKKTGRLAPSVILHMVYNALVV